MSFASSALEAFSTLHGWPLYAIVGILAFGEAAAFLGLLLPGETAILLGAALAAQGNARIDIYILIVAVAVVTGDTTGYTVGRRLGPRIRTGRIGARLGTVRWQTAEDAIARRGILAVILGRWVGILRALVPATAGATGKPFRKFLPAAMLGGLSWAVTVSLLGYAAGNAWPKVDTSLKQAGLVVGVLAVALLFGRKLIRVSRRRTAQGVRIRGRLAGGGRGGTDRL